MYRTNQHRGVSPRDCLDPRLLGYLGNTSEMPAKISETCNCQMARRRAEENTCENKCDNYDAEFDYALAMVYPPMQNWQNIYCEEEGFVAGTIFRELDKPFYGSKCRGGNMYE